MNLTGKRIALFVENFYEDQEFWYPFYRMKEEGAVVTVIGSGAESFKSKHDYPAKADISADKARAQDFDALIIPGGYAPDHMRRSPAMVRFVKEMNQQGKLIAAVCHAPWMLASAEIIDGKTVTGFPSIKDDLVHAGANYVDKEVVRDRNIITSRKPDDLPAFCRTIIDSLAAVEAGAH